MVEDAARPGTTLVVGTRRPAVMEPAPLPAEIVLPRDVAGRVRAARSSGCTPRPDGSPFELHLSATG
ncbi:hypothetical protein [Streptomyces sp. NPDC048720]|uniref:hypothetical protein n=1 Tax=Streptomyces sp. NPDC048720 TaxID=3365588 RepID=UPI00370F9D6B